MDGSPGAGLPPIAPAPGAPPAMVGGYPPAPGVRPQAAGVVGRPANDPDQQAARVERSAQQKRLEGLSPGRAKDQKLYVFATVGGRSRGKPVLTLLSNEVEEHLSSCTPGASRDDEIDEFITQRMPEDLPDAVYKCQWYDKNNRPINDPPAWELTVGDPQGAMGDNPGYLDEDPPGFMGGAGAMPVQSAFAPPAPAAPPAPPAVDLGTMGRVIHQERAAEANHGNQLMTLMAAQQQQLQQMQAQERQWAKEAEEREKTRRADFRRDLLAFAPLALPFLSQLFGPKPAPAPVANPAEALMLEVVKATLLNNKGIDPADTMKQMLSFQAELAKSQMQLQQSGTTAAMAMQSEATSAVFKNMLNTIKELQENKKGGGEEKSTLATIAEIAGPLIAAVQAQQQQQPAQPLPAPPAAAPAEAAQPRRSAVKEQPPVAPPSSVVGPQTAAPAAAPPPAATPRRAAARRPAESDPAKFSDAKRIENVMLTARKMSIGEIAPQDRWGAIRFICQWMPLSVVEAVKAKNEPKVTELSLSVALGNATLLQWVGDPENQGFLRDVLEDARLLLTKEATEEKAEASVIKAGAFVQRRRQAQATQGAKDQAAIDAHNSPPDAAPAKPAVEATLVTDPTVGIAPPAAPPAKPQPPTPG